MEQTPCTSLPFVLLLHSPSCNPLFFNFPAPYLLRAWGMLCPDSLKTKVMLEHLSPATRLALAKYIKGYYPYELANLYDETPKTFMAWIKPHEQFIGKLEGKKYTPLQTGRIFECLGIPPGVYKELEKSGITDL